MNFPDAINTSAFDSCDSCGCVPCACEDIAADFELRDGETVDDIPTVDECIACGGEAQLLGILGPLAHYRCRQCGAQCSRTIGVASA